MISCDVKYGRLTAKEYVGNDNHGHKTWKFLCDCGNIKICAETDVIRKNVSSCGVKCPLKSIKPEKMICCRCKTEMPFTSEFFPIHKKCKWGLETACRKCTCKKAKVVNLEERKRLKQEVLTQYSKNKQLACNCCGEHRIEFLTIDHIHGNGKQDRKGYPATMFYRRLRRDKYPSGYRTLCFNCNSSYGMYGYCPHQQ